jgi:para-aminobenzoate synthetase component 1
VIFLDSSLVDAEIGRYSFVAADPVDWISARENRVHLNGVSQAAVDPLELVARRIEPFRHETIEGLPPFQGGVAGIFSYEWGRTLEQIPRARHDEFEAPDLALGVYDWVIGFDRLSHRSWLISTGYPEADPERRSKAARRRLEEISKFLNESKPGITVQALRSAHAAPVELAERWPVPSERGTWSNFSRDDYIAAVERVREYIAAGDCFQVNLAQRLIHPADVPPLELYRRLRARNPAPFSGYMDLGDFVVASASPERFLQVQDGSVTTRPIKGTRPRGRNQAEDRGLARELTASSKDRSENVMIVDLMRNDLGRVCRFGTVHVRKLCALETHPFVHHLVSEVGGELRPELGPMDLLRATFPGGSVTGAPKIRAMEIIAELEPNVRGPYCGSLAYIGFDRSMDASILIRTFTVGRGWIQFPVGGGIVADSCPAKEFEETMHKAAGLFRALRSHEGSP